MSCYTSSTVDAFITGVEWVNDPNIYLVDRQYIESNNSTILIFEDDDYDEPDVALSYPDLSPIRLEEEDNERE
jgi:hypothetical protein